jgi:carbamoyl-phosphate synthase small subunit
MVGYPEALTDPSYRGQILVLTYPLIGNYGIANGHKPGSLDSVFESDHVQISGLIVSEYSDEHSHWSATTSFKDWLISEGVPALYGIDTRLLTKRLRYQGSLLAKIDFVQEELSFEDPNKQNLVAQVSTRERVVYQRGKRRVVLVDCGCKNGIIRSFLDRDVTVIRVPYDYDFLKEDCEAIVVSNGPGDPKMCDVTIGNIGRAFNGNRPILGICLGSQLMGLASGANTYKLKFGHRGQNQPCIELETGRCYITSQNHGYAVDQNTLSSDWRPWFVNANDGTIEGIRHRSKPFMGVQFHPEAAPGPTDTNFLVDDFLSVIP